MMVSAWWLLVTFWIGGALGLVLGVLAASARKQGGSRDDAEQEEALERWLEAHRQMPPAPTHAPRRRDAVPRN